MSDTSTLKALILYDRLDLIGPERLGVIWDALSSDPQAPLFWTDWTPRRYIDFLRAQGPENLPIVAELHGEVVGACWVRHSRMHPETGLPLDCLVEGYLMPGHRGREGQQIGLALKRHILDVWGYQNLFAMVKPAYRLCRVMLHAWGMTRVGVLPGYAPVQGRLEDMLLYSAVAPGEKR